MTSRSKKPTKAADAAAEALFAEPTQVPRTDWPEGEVLEKPTAPIKRDRRKFLGGSDAAAVMGLSPWKTPVELWMHKTGRTVEAPPDPGRKKIYDRGHKLEPFIRDMTVDRLEELGVRVELLRINGLYEDPNHPFLACEVDFELKLWGDVEINGELVTFDGEHINCDAKSVAGFGRMKWGDEGTEDVPIEYAAQFMHGLGLTGRRYCLVAALRSFDDVDLYWTVRDDETIEAMRAKMVSFWLDHVVADVPPDPQQWSDLYKLFPKDNTEARECTAEMAEKIAKLQVIKDSIKAYGDEAERLQFEIGDFIRPYAYLNHAGQQVASWKAQNDSRVDNEVLKALEVYTKDAETGEFKPANAYALAVRTKEIRVFRISKKGLRTLKLYIEEAKKEQADGHAVDALLADPT